MIQTKKLGQLGLLCGLMLAFNSKMYFICQNNSIIVFASEDRVASQMTHTNSLHYMHYVLNHVVYELYTIFCHSTLESYISSLSIKAATVVRHQHTTFFF